MALCVTLNLFSDAFVNVDVAAPYVFSEYYVAQANIQPKKLAIEF